VVRGTMLHSVTRLALASLSFALLDSASRSRTHTQAAASYLTGRRDSLPTWGAGWIDLSSPIDFRKSERLRLVIGGSAARVVVRLLPVGASHRAREGIAGVPMTVPKTRTIEVVLSADFPRTRQISVHGGPTPWHEVDLGVNNGPATLVSVARILP